MRLFGLNIGLQSAYVIMSLTAGSLFIVENSYIAD